jgi:hypothetical protein
MSSFGFGSVFVVPMPGEDITDLPHLLGISCQFQHLDRRAILLCVRRGIAQVAEQTMLDQHRNVVFATVQKRRCLPRC